MKTAIIFLIAIIVGVVVSPAIFRGGGDITKEDGNKSVMSDETYALNDGRKVTCIVGFARLSCDWDRAK